MKLEIDWTLWGSLMALNVNGTPKMTTPFVAMEVNSAFAPIQNHTTFGRARHIVVSKCQRDNSEEFLS